MIEKWCTNTSLNGIIDLYESRHNRFHFIFWIFVMCTLFVITLYLTVLNIKNFFTSPTVTKIDTISEPEIEMPEILLCYKGGLNVKKMKSFNLSDELIAVLQHGYHSQNESGIDELTAEKEFRQFQKDRQLGVKAFYQHVTSHECHDVILSRRRAGDFNSDSKCMNVTTFVNEDAHSCIIMKNNGRQTIENPAQGGINLIITVPNGAYLHHLDHTEFTNSFTMAFDKTFIVQGDKNIEIGLGYKVTILISLTRILRLPRSHPCFAEREDNNHQAGECHKESLSNLTKAYCNCTISGIIDEEICSVFQFRKLCLPIWQQIVTEAVQNTRKNCIMPCDEFVFDTSLSFAPLEIKTISRINIGYSNMHYTKVEEVDAFTWDVAIANVGGQAGLWMGCSIVTIIECLFYIFINFCSKKSTTFPITAELQKKIEF